MSASSEITSRYNVIEREQDALGRLIGVKRLNPAQLPRVMAMTSDLEGDQVTRDNEGNEVRIPIRTTSIIAASVVELDGMPVTFPKTRGELDAILIKLDNEGIEAAGVALGRVMSGDGPGGIEAAKNAHSPMTHDKDSGSSKMASRSTSRSRSTTTSLQRGE